MALGLNCWSCMRAEELSLITVDFQISLGKGQKDFENLYVKKGKRNGYYRDMLIKLEALYKQNISISDRAVSNLPIPLLTHQIWLGKEYPLEYREWRSSWLKIHPHWHYILWVDNPKNYQEGIVVQLRELATYLSDDAYCGKVLVVDVKDFPLYNQELYMISKNYGERSDLLRVELLYHFGGLYLDIDFQALKTLDVLHLRYDLYCGMVHLENLGMLANGILASVPQHPLFKRYMETLKTIWEGKSTLQRGPQHFDYCFYTLLCAGFTDRVIALPPTYFFPIKHSQVMGKENLTPEVVKNLCNPETLAIHHWAGTWSKPFSYVKKV